MKIITRFAPSPTGYLHIGGARTALYSWLFSRSNKGIFILRIEDTDINRSNIKSVNSIIEGLKWLKINWDKGPFFQTNNLYRYNKIINLMLNNGNAYKCYCSKNRLNLLRNYQIKNNIKPRYDKFCINFKNKNENKKYVIRFLNPENGYVIFNDKIRGLIKTNNNELDDFIICRENGIPTYNFSSVIDDLDMNITHIIRGSEHINNTPKQINIFKSLGCKIPKYAHVSIILGDDGKKLSKRYFSNNINDYKYKGYIPEALINYILKLGWSYKNKEIFTISEMKKYFNFKNFVKSSSIFDIKKLNWINQYYLNNMSIKKIKSNILPYIKENKLNISKKPKIENVIKLFNKRCKNLVEMSKFFKYIYNIDIIINYKVIKYILKFKNIFKILIIIYNKFNKIKFWTYKNINNIIFEIKNEFNLNMYNVCMPLRIIITGKKNTPNINNIIYIIKKKKTLYRINNLINILFNFKYFD
ncbi:glutamate--tRNA ligase [Enterobacteriaceae bacterium ET-AT1-13]|nr:glutamate--tRNA ligase [Enterobacteriaceae bacterium ET-AT1-13]WGS66460.1 glutamate--tRNA ligase [Enterobacteriaceae bacterium Cmel17]WMC17485.1 MAG: glutamate--tRNA ligase [Enterobacteriaceae bacterium Cmel21]WMC17691.1 MAG: glutamate--tRNA ligase [Enterobacteriaceae bacterium PSmelAO3-2]WMC17895.1 MAG: glutamate--tRNA ligase [Enterobacteriaceae bacterium PSmelAO3-1]WMC18098.1 MAG: glutamate--tRNA ligase [Enterobacteriaceae bacterium PSmelAO1]